MACSTCLAHVGGTRAPGARVGHDVPVPLRLQIAIPMFRNFTSVFPGARPILDYMIDNYRHWQHRYPGTGGGGTASNGSTTGNGATS